jgi:hypothetical protein
MDTAKLRDALDEANRGLQEAEARLEAMRLRIQHLKAVASSIGALLAAGEQTFSSPVLPAPVALSESYNSEVHTKMEALPQWAMARDLLLETGHAMTVPQMVQVLASRGQVIQSDGLRVAMIRRPDLFIKPEYGKYGLKAWEADYLERATEEAFDYRRENPMEETRIA